VRIAREDVALVLLASGTETFLGSEDQLREMAAPWSPARACLVIARARTASGPVGVEER